MVTRDRGTILFTGATACAARRAPTSPRSPARSTRCARSRRAWRASSGRRASTSRTSSSTARSTPSSSAANFPERYAIKAQDGILTRPHRRDLLVPAHAAARRLDLRARPAALERTLVARFGATADLTPTGSDLRILRMRRRVDAQRHCRADAVSRRTRRSDPEAARPSVDRPRAPSAAGRSSGCCGSRTAATAAGCRRC